MIADLSAHAGFEPVAEGRGILAEVTSPRRYVPPKKRRRRRHKSRPDIVRKAKRGTVAKATVAAPEPTSAAAKPAPTKTVRGHGKFVDQLAELEKIRVGIAAGDAKSAHALQVRGDAVLREMAGKAKLPLWLDKAERMRWRGAAKQPEAAPRKKKPRKPTPPPVPPVKRDSGWHADANGNLAREIATE